MDLSKNEFNALCDLMNGHLWFEEFDPKEEIFLSLQYSKREISTKWEIDGSLLLSKINSLTKKDSIDLKNKIIKFWEDK